MRSELLNWKDDEGVVNVGKEMAWILSNSELFFFFLNKYREEMQHCGASYHAVVTLLKQPSLLCLTVGYLTSHTKSVTNFLETTPPEEKCFQVGTKLKRVTTVKEEAMWTTAVARASPGTSTAKLKKAKENLEEAVRKRKTGRNSGRFKKKPKI